jgi:Ca2+-binding EF-hand superfamily protein
LEVYFVEILFKRKYSGKESSFWTEKKISIREFIDFMYESCFFVKVRPSKSDLLSIFEILDTDKDGFISFEEYINFIRHYLGRGLQIIDSSKS